MAPMPFLDPPTGEVSISAADLKAGALPWVCARSGRRADDTIRVQYQENPNAAWAGLLPGAIGRRYVVKGRLPMSVRWITVITSARMLVLAALVAFGYGFWAVTFGRPATTAGWVLLVTGLLALQAWRIVRVRLEPTGEVHRDATGNAWVVLRGVHANFVAAVQSARGGLAAEGQMGAATDPQRT